MPSFDLANKSLKYAASDLTLIEKVATLMTAMADYDPAAKQDATTALTSLRALRTHVAGKRKPAEAAK